MKEVWDNQTRNRYYGLRIGDTITRDFVEDNGNYKIVGYGAMDNNRVYIQRGNEKPFGVVAEHCHIVHKIEDQSGG